MLETNSEIQKFSSGTQKQLSNLHFFDRMNFYMDTAYSVSLYQTVTFLCLVWLNCHLNSILLGSGNYHCQNYHNAWWNLDEEYSKASLFYQCNAWDFSILQKQFVWDKLYPLLESYSLKKVELKYRSAIFKNWLSAPWLIASQLILICWSRSGLWCSW